MQGKHRATPRYLGPLRYFHTTRLVPGGPLAVLQTATPYASLSLRSRFARGFALAVSRFARSARLRCSAWLRWFAVLSSLTSPGHKGHRTSMLRAGCLHCEPHATLCHSCSRARKPRPAAARHSPLRLRTRATARRQGIRLSPLGCVRASSSFASYLGSSSERLARIQRGHARCVYAVRNADTSCCPASPGTCSVPDRPACVPQSFPSEKAE